MTYSTGFLPDLHIVSERDLFLLQRGAAGGDPAPAAGSQLPPWPAGALDSVLDELERRDACPVGHRPVPRGPSH